MLFRRVGFQDNEDQIWSKISTEIQALIMKQLMVLFELTKSNLNLCTKVIDSVSILYSHLKGIFFKKVDLKWPELSHFLSLCFGSNLECDLLIGLEYCKKYPSDMAELFEPLQLKSLFHPIQTQNLNVFKVLYLD